MLNKIKIGPKLIGGFSVVIALVLAMTITTLSSLATLRAMQDRGGAIALDALNADHARRMPYKLYSVAAEAEVSRDLEDAATSWASDTKEWGEVRSALAARVESDKEKAWLAQAEPEVAAGIKVYEEQMLPLLKQPHSPQNDAAVRKLLGVLDTRFKASQVPLREWATALETEAVDADKAFDAKALQVVTLTIIIAIVAALFALFVGITLTRSITGPLTKGVTMMQELSRGHLGQRLKMEREDEIGVLARTMDSFADELQNVVVGIMTKISEGDLSTEVSVSDAQDEISPALRNTIISIRGLVQETVALSKAGTEGRLATRGNVDQFKGGYRQVVQGINETLDAVVQPLNEATAVLARVAERDLSARMTGTYQNDLLALKTALNTAVQNLSDALADVAGSAEQVAVASQQIASGSQLLAQGTSEQAAAVEEVSASLQEVSSMSQQNATNAQEAKGMAERGRTSVKSGIDSMDRLTAAIQKIKESSDATARIVKTIDEIAFQTNLLALNAAVEAARAGDAGKGFAVVADEVRSLAIRSAEAAKSTAALIEEGVQASGTGVALNAESLKALQDIDAQMDKIGEMLAEIATASNEQNQGVGQITTAIESVNQTTQSAAANAEESAATSEELSAQAAQMQGIVGSFQLADAAATSGVSVKGIPAAVRRPAPAAPRVGTTPPNRIAHALRSNGNGKTVPSTAKSTNGRSHAFDLDSDDEATLDSF